MERRKSDTLGGGGDGRSVMNFKGPSINDVHKIMKFFLTPIPSLFRIWSRNKVVNPCNLLSYISVRTSFVNGPQDERGEHEQQLDVDQEEPAQEEQLGLEPQGEEPAAPQERLPRRRPHAPARLRPCQHFPRYRIILTVGQTDCFIAQVADKFLYSQLDLQGVPSAQIMVPLEHQLPSMNIEVINSNVAHQILRAVIFSLLVYTL